MSSENEAHTALGPSRRFSCGRSPRQGGGRLVAIWDHCGHRPLCGRRPDIRRGHGDVGTPLGALPPPWRTACLLSTREAGLSLSPSPL